MRLVVGDGERVERLNAGVDPVGAIRFHDRPSAWPRRPSVKDHSGLLSTSCETWTDVPVVERGDLSGSSVGTLANPLPLRTVRSLPESNTDSSQLLRPPTSQHRLNWSFQVG